MYSSDSDSSDEIVLGSPRRSNLSRPSRKLFLLTGLSIIGGFLFGYDTGVVSGAFLLVRREMQLTDAWHELLVSGTIGFAFLTALCAGSLADRIGRRPAILVASLLFGLGSVVMAISPGKLILLFGRLLVGIGVGLASTVVPLYIGECSTSELRGVLVAVNIAAVTFGQMIAGICCGLLLEVPSGWRAMLGLAVIPAVAQLIGFYFMPESPRYLVKMGRVSEAENVLSSIRNPFHQIQDELDDIRISVNNARESVSFIQFLQNFLFDRHARKSVILGCLLQCCQQLAGINTVMYYAASIIKMTGASDQVAVWSSAATAAINFIFTLLGLKLVHRLSRKKLLLGSLGCVVISLLCISASFKRLENQHSDNSTSYLSKREITDLAMTSKPIFDLSQIPIRTTVKEETSTAETQTTIKNLPSKFLTTLHGLSTETSTESSAVSKPSTQEVQDETTSKAEEIVDKIVESLSMNDESNVDKITADNVVESSSIKDESIVGKAVESLSLKDESTMASMEQEVTQERVAEENKEAAPKRTDEDREADQQDNSTVGYLMSHEGEVMILISMAMYIASFAPGMGPLPWTINSELHPVWCRAQAQALATSTNWVSNLLVSFTFLSLTASIGRSLTFLTYAIVTAVSGLILAKWLPETKGVSLENVEVLFSPSTSTDKSGEVAYSPMSMDESRR